MMRYWDMVVDEVLNGEEKGSDISYTNVCLYKEDPLLKVAERRPNPHKRKRDRRKYFLGSDYPDVYFTKMELTTFFHLSDGKSTNETAEVLSLSKRTIEYYLRNMKQKLQCRFSTELISKVSESELIQGVKEDGKNSWEYLLGEAEE